MCHGADCSAWDAEADLRAASERGLNERMPAVPSKRATATRRKPVENKRGQSQYNRHKPLAQTHG